MCIQKITVLFLIITVCSTGASAQRVNKTERKIVSAIDKRNNEALELLKKSVKINSGTMNLRGVRQVGTLFKQELDKLGFETRLSEGDAFQRAGHLVAVRKGNKGPKFLLIGHLDTVFEPDSPFQDYKMLNDSIMQGPGVADMKGGDVIIILAMQALHDAGVLEGMNIEIVMTGDEEKSGSPLALSKKDLIEAAKTADIALGFENADGDPHTVVVARRGSVSWELTVEGKPAHSSQIFTENVGAGAIYEAARILTEFYNKLSAEENLTFNPGVILGGTSVEASVASSGGTAFGKSNVVAQRAVVQGDIRAVSPEQLTKAQTIMQEIVSRNLLHTSALLKFEDGYPPLANTEGNKKILSQYDKVSQDLGFGAVGSVHPRRAGAADISFTSGLVDMALDGLGLKGGANDHTINETGNIKLLPVQAKRAAVLMYRLAYNKVQ